MKIETKTIRNGGMVGETVWVCQYHRPDLDKKPLRNVPPTKVQIVSNKELPKNKRVYYSESHFRPISESGKILARVISPVDATGYRSYCGNEIDVFDNEDECKAAWDEQLKEAIVRLHDRELTAAAMWRDQKDDLYARLACP